SDAAVLEEDQVALGYDVLPQVGRAEGIGKDYQLKCDLINRCFQEECCEHSHSLVIDNPSPFHRTGLALIAINGSSLLLLGPE
ncbi:uncharacterized protein F5147DRAFT_738046, partial [Suillus discolor]